MTPYDKWVKERARQTAGLNSLIPKTSRSSVTGGAHKYKQSTKVRYLAAAKAAAKRDVKLMKEKGILSPDDKIAEEALLGVLEQLRGPNSAQVKLAAARTLLDFTKAKPATKSEVTVNAAEAWLESLAKE